MGSQQQPNETLQRLVDDYQRVNRNTIHLDGDITLPAPSEEQKRNHVRQRSITKRKRNSIYQDYSLNLPVEIEGSKESPPENINQQEFTHCKPVHTELRGPLLECLDIYRGSQDPIPREDTEDHESNGTAVIVLQHNLVSFAGLRNLIFLVLVYNNCDKCLQLAKTFSLMAFWGRVRHSVSLSDDLIYCAITVCVSLMSIVVAFAIEKSAVQAISPSSKLHRMINVVKPEKSLKKKKSITNIQLRQMTNLSNINRISLVTLLLHLANVLIYLIGVNWIVYKAVQNCLIGTVTTLMSVVITLKLISYCLANKELRVLYVKSLNHKSLTSSATLLNTRDTDDKLIYLPRAYDSCQYPKNVSLANILQYSLFPTLVYQPVYPMNWDTKRNYPFVLYKSIEIVALMFAIQYLNNHYALPYFATLLSLLSKNTLTTNTSIQILDISLRLSATSILMWIIVYYSFFHDVLSIIAELTRFGDRDFYYNWWNSETIANYWAHWNKPLNKFMRRHLSFLDNNSMFFVFAIIAELVVAVPTHNFAGLAFISIIMQIIWIRSSEMMYSHSRNGRRLSFTGNCIFWFNLFLGHPLFFLFYYLSWYFKNSYLQGHSI